MGQTSLIVTPSRVKEDQLDSKSPCSVCTSHHGSAHSLCLHLVMIYTVDSEGIATLWVMFSLRRQNTAARTGCLEGQEGHVLAWEQQTCLDSPSKVLEAQQKTLARRKLRDTSSKTVSMSMNLLFSFFYIYLYICILYIIIYTSLHNISTHYMET